MSIRSRASGDHRFTSAWNTAASTKQNTHNSQIEKQFSFLSQYKTESDHLWFPNAFQGNIKDKYKFIKNLNSGSSKKYLAENKKTKD